MASRVRAAAELAAAYKRLGELYQQRGDRDQARMYYSRFVELGRTATWNCSLELSKCAAGWLNSASQPKAPRIKPAARLQHKSLGRFGKTSAPRTAYPYLMSTDGKGSEEGSPRAKGNRLRSRLLGS